MAIFQLFLSLFCFFLTVRSQCEIVTDETDWSKYDLNPLMNPTVDYEVLNERYPTYSFKINICRGITYSDSVCGPDLGICEYSSFSSTKVGAVAKTFTVQSPGVLLMKFPPPTTNCFNGEIIFICDEEAGIGAPKYVNENCLYQFEWRTAHACPLRHNFLPLPSLKEQSEIEQGFTNERIETILPELMRQYNVSMWIIAQREYGEDNVFFAIKSSTQFASRRRTINVFFDDGVSVKRTDFVDNTDQIWENLNNLLEDSDPETIALNIDEDFAFSDGLRSGEREILERNLGEKYLSRVVRQPLLALDFIASRTDSMVVKYKEIMETVWFVISLGFSSQVIIPGETTTTDMVWWFREKIQELGYTTWFQTSVGAFRKGSPSQVNGVIEKGDMLWCDIGFTAYNLHTDTQHLGYVLKDDETDVPDGLKAGLKNANTMQDILMRQIQVGRTGNEILASSQEELRDMGLNGTFYSHPIGDDGHGAGTLIGYVNIQTPVPIRGDVKVIKKSWYSIELQSTTAIPEWDGQAIEFRQEEDMYIDEQGNNHWVYGRRTDFHLVK